MPANHDPRTRTSPTRPRAAFAPVLGFALFGWLCAFAQAQDPAVARLVRTDAVRLLRSPDALVRGEAALVAAGGRDRDVLAQIVPLLTDDHAECRHRALLALGVFGTVAAVDVLDNWLRDANRHSDADGVVAAFALGLATEDAASGAVTRLLATITQGSWKRQRDLLTGLLLGISLQTERHDGAALRRLLDNESNRDPEVRALLLHLLLPVDATLRGRELEHVLNRGESAERAVVLQWLGNCDDGIDSALLPLVERTAARSGSASERAAALLSLCRVHHVRSVELAQKALRSREPVEAAAGLAVLLTLGGARMRVPLEQRLLEEKEPDCLAALLQRYQAPMSEALADHCARLAQDPAANWRARAIALVTLGHHRAERAEPLLRAAFAQCQDPASLVGLAQAMQRGPKPAAPLSSLLEPGTSLASDLPRWTALVRAGHPEALRTLLHTLSSRDATPAALAASLSVWRHAALPLTPTQHGGALPAALRTLLGQ